MKKLIFICLVCFSCSPKIGFNAFFEKEVDIADQAIDVPKWLPMIAIPEEAKIDIKRFTKGMKRVKVLRYKNRREEGKDHFLNFKQEMEMEEYMSIRNKDMNLNVISKEEEGSYKEIILSCDVDDAYFIFGMTGKMKYADFQSAVAEVNKRNEKRSDE